ncbi:MAG: hypothetical protein AVDCRST_MAG68-3443, partial [uncultured Gemmatimonadetes bacterium]
GDAFFSVSLYLCVSVSLCEPRRPGNGPEARVYVPHRASLVYRRPEQM